MLETVSQLESSTYSSLEFFKNRWMEARLATRPSVRLVSAPKGGNRYRPSRLRERFQDLPEPRWSIKDW